MTTIALEQPDRVAIRCNGRSTTYGELQERACRLAGYLAAQGVGTESLVGIALEKSTEYLVALIAIWYARGGFLPLDPTLPRERLAYLAQDSKTKIVITDHAALFSGLVTVDPHAEAEPIEPEENRVQDLAYVIYTSGSTGRPKGVAVTHSGITSFLLAQMDLFQLTRESRTLQYVSTSFDASVSEIGTALLSGGVLCVEPPNALSAARLAGTLERCRITHVCLPPSLLPRLDLETMPSCLETIIIGGEVCPPRVVRAWAERFRLINIYGPTEATVCTSMCCCDASWSRPLIGSPLPGVGLHLLDDDLEPVEHGTPAELFISGIGLAREYINRPELTAEKFVEHRGQRLYRTGDLVQAHEEGIVFVGRRDRQVKIRGQLVEPREVESRLLEHAAVQNAAVVKRPIEQGRGLVAFVVLRSSVSPMVLRQHLAAQLPRWMLPERFVFLEELPHTHYKIDLAQLVVQDLPPVATEAVAPQTAEERTLVNLWRRALDVELGVTDDFFQLGGDSLLVLEVIAEASLFGLSIPPAVFFRYPTIRSLVAALHFDSDGRTVEQLERETTGWDAGYDQDVGAVATRILLTGATGFLGARLLHHLSQQPEIEQVYCLVRSPQPGGIVGDLREERFGWSADQYRGLSNEIDAVYHAGAVVHRLAPYEVLACTNVGGTKEVLRFCASGKPKRLHHVSSLSVFTASDTAETRVEETTDLRAMHAIYGGYAQSKWVAERLVQRAAVPVSIYRLGLLTGDRDPFLSFLRSLMSWGCLPEVALPLLIDVTPVDYAAAALVYLSRTTTGTFHIANPRTLSLQEVVDAFHRRGEPLRVVDLDVFQERAIDPSAYLAMCRCLPGFEQLRSLDLFQATGMTFGMDRTLACLAGSELSCPLPEDLLETYLDILKEIRCASR